MRASALVLLALALGGCASNRGIVTEQVTEHRAKVKFEESDLKTPLKEGSKVYFLSEICRTRKGPGKYLSTETIPSCYDSRIGSGLITKVVSPEEALVDGNDQIVLEKGMELELDM